MEPIVRYILAALSALALLWVLAKLLFDWEKDERIVTKATKGTPAPRPSHPVAPVAEKPRPRPPQPVVPAVPKPQPRPRPQPKPSVTIPVAAAAAPVAKSASPDDLTKIEGIGPAVQRVLNGSGIKTFAQLAAKDPNAVSEIMRGAGSRFQMHAKSAQSWPRQAGLADQGDWDALEKLQDSLNAGK